MGQRLLDLTARRSLAQLKGYDAQPVNFDQQHLSAADDEGRIETNDRGQLIAVGRDWDLPDDGSYRFETSAGFLVWHKQGYATDISTDGKQIKLRKFGKISGTVPGGKAGQKVTMRWESFPWEPTVIKLDKTVLKNVPPLFAVTLETTLDKKGQFRFDTVPVGRVRLDLEHAAGTSTSTNTIWLDSQSNLLLKVTFKQQGRPVNGMVLLSAIRDHLFATNREMGMPVAGPVKVLPLEPTAVLRGIIVPSGGEEEYGMGGYGDAGMEEMGGGFGGGFDDEYGGVSSAPRTITAAQAVQRALTFGRKGGQREQQSAPFYARIDKSGKYRFPAVPPGLYELSIKGRYFVDTRWYGNETILTLGNFSIPMSKKQTPWTIGADTDYGMDTDIMGMGVEDMELEMAMEMAADVTVFDEEEASTQGKEEPLDAWDSFAIDAGEPAAAESLEQLSRNIVAASDEASRRKLIESLRVLLQEQFDTEQEKKEQLVNTLAERLKSVEQQISRRKSRRGRIIEEQLDKLVGER